MRPAAVSDREIEALLSTPTGPVVEAVGRLRGNFAVLGVGGKMGTSVAVMLRRALDAAGRRDATVTGVSRFSRTGARQELESFGVKTLACDLACADEVRALPGAEHVLYLAGQKFGTDSNPGATWIQNTVVPSLVAQHYRESGMVVFSTGCVYPFAAVDGPGCNEDEPPAFNGEYASSCVGRERIFGHYSRQLASRQLFFRLNYAVELRYGVLVDIASRVLAGEPVDVSTGWFNCIWQGDACAQAIRCLEHVSSPPAVLNVTGLEKLSVREVAEQFGLCFDRRPVFTGREAATAWLADASRAGAWFGRPETTVPEMIERIAGHLAGGGAVHGKPTHFETRSGQF